MRSNQLSYARLLQRRGLNPRPHHYKWKYPNLTPSANLNPQET